MLQSFRLRYMQYEPVFMKLKLRTGQRNVLVFALIDGSESASGCQNNICLGTTLP